LTDSVQKHFTICHFQNRLDTSGKLMQTDHFCGVSCFGGIGSFFFFAYFSAAGKLGWFAPPFGGYQCPELHEQ
jgi:hypothetical protein